MTPPADRPRYRLAVPARKDEEIFTWESQAAQYPETGPPGFSLVQLQAAPGIAVDCLLYRDESGALVGIANHFPADIPPHERSGAWAVWVHPGHRRQGIGRALVVEGLKHWDYQEQHISFTGSGAGLINSFRREHNATGEFPNFDSERHHLPLEDGTWS